MEAGEVCLEEVVVCLEEVVVCWEADSVGGFAEGVDGSVLSAQTDWSEAAIFVGDRIVGW
jgi:hypothetical protein